MTIARTLAGDVIGQTLTGCAHHLLYTDMNCPQCVAELRGEIILLGRDGRYVTVPASSVRLEEV